MWDICHWNGFLEWVIILCVGYMSFEMTRFGMTFEFFLNIRWEYSFWTNSLRNSQWEWLFEKIVRKSSWIEPSGMVIENIENLHIITSCLHFTLHYTLQLRRRFCAILRSMRIHIFGVNTALHHLLYHSGHHTLHQKIILFNPKKSNSSTRHRLKFNYKIYCICSFARWLISDDSIQFELRHNFFILSHCSH